MMKREYVIAWVEWLYANQDKQGRQVLRYVGADDITRYCCLGGLCEVVRARKPELITLISGSGYVRPRAAPDWKTSESYENSIIPAWLVEELGIASRNPVLDFGPDTPEAMRAEVAEYGLSLSASKANDEFSLSFATIARAVMRTYLPPWT